MPTLRLDVTAPMVISGGSNWWASELSYLEALRANNARQFALMSITQVSFFYRNGAEEQDVFIRRAVPSSTEFYWGVWTSDTNEYTEHPLSYTESTPSVDVYRVEIPIPDAVNAVLQKCAFVDYQQNGLNGELYGAITTEDTGSGIGYLMPYDFFTSTTSYVRGEIVGADATLFDSSEIVTGPMAEVYGNYTSPLHWTFVPDIFWTQRILCEET